MDYLTLKEETLTSKFIDDSRHHIVLQSIIHTSEMPEDSIWPKMIEALNQWFNVSEDILEKIVQITRLVQVVNNTINDASEDAQLRKGVATANSIHGVADALNSSYYSSFIVLEKLRDMYEFEGIKLGNEYYLDLSRGQGMEIYFRDNLICPTEDEYLKIAVRKTGGLLRLTVRLMQLFSENKSDYSNLITIFGKFFHIYDDYVSLYNWNEYLLNKNGLENISEGRFSFPLVHGIRTHLEDVQLINILRQKSTCEEVVTYCVTLLDKFGSLEYTKETLRKLKQEADKEFEKFEKNPAINKIFEDIYSKLNL